MFRCVEYNAGEEGRGGGSVWFGRKRRGKEKISFLVRQPPSQKIEKKE